jgi:protein TonB
MAGGGDLDKGRVPPRRCRVHHCRRAATPSRSRRSTTVDRCRSSRWCCWPRCASRSPRCRRPNRAAPELTAEQLAREEKRRQLVKLLAEIERRINEQNARPKKRYVSPATREEVYAVYYDNLRRLIEDKGTENFPTANGKKLYGELTMVVTVNFDGRVLATEIVDSSGNSRWTGAPR